MPRSTTHLVSLARGILEWAEERGIDRERLVRASRLDRGELDGDDGRVRSDAIVAIWREIERVLADENFGLKAAESILRPSSLGVVGLLAMTSNTVGESIERSVRYSRVLKGDVVARSYVVGPSLVVELQTFASSPRSIMDVSMAAFRFFMERWTGQKVSVREVFFRHEKPSNASEYERLFPCRVHFGHATNAVVFDREVLEIPLLTSQPDIARYLERVARTKLHELLERENRDLATDVVHAIRGGLEHGDVHIATVARSVGMSARTLQRALGARGLVYRELVDRERLAVATQLVTQTDTPLERIADRLGYAEAKAFRRAFRRWTGRSPTEIRRGATSREPP